MSDEKEKKLIIVDDRRQLDRAHRAVTFAFASIIVMTGGMTEIHAAAPGLEVCRLAEILGLQTACLPRAPGSGLGWWAGVLATASLLAALLYPLLLRFGPSQHARGRYHIHVLLGVAAPMLAYVHAGALPSFRHEVVTAGLFYCLLAVSLSGGIGSRLLPRLRRPDDFRWWRPAHTALAGVVFVLLVWHVATTLLYGR